MKGKINVLCVIGREFNTGDFTVTTKAKLINKEGSSAFGKGFANLSLKSKYPVSFEALQVLAAKKNMISHLEDKGGIEFKNCPADFIYAKAKNEDRWYYAVVVDMGTEDFPLKRTFYLNAMQEAYLKSFTPEYEFTKTENVLDDSESDNA